MAPVHERESLREEEAETRLPAFAFTGEAADRYYGFVLDRIKQLEPHAVLLRGPAHLHPAQASEGSSDLDVLVSVDHPGVRDFLKAEGFHRVYKPQSYLERFRRHVPELPKPFTIDLYTAERWGLGYRLAKSDRIPADPELACLVHAIADRKGTAYFERARNGPPWRRGAKSAVNFGPLGRLLWRWGRTAPLTLYLLGKGVIRPEPAAIARNLLRRVSFRAWQLSRNTGLEVALLGVDGVGKSGVAKSLTQLPAPVLVIYMGPHDHRTRLMRFLDRRRFPAILRQVGFRYDLMARRLAGWLHARRGWIIIYDRHPAERLEPNPGSFRRALQNLLEGLSAWPVDWTFWLTGDYQAIYLRKKEYPPDRLQATDERYQRLLQRRKIPFERIDVVENDLQTVTEKVGRAVLARYLERASADDLPKVLKEILT